MKKFAACLLFTGLAAVACTEKKSTKPKVLREDCRTRVNAIARVKAGYQAEVDSILESYATLDSGLFELRSKLMEAILQNEADEVAGLVEQDTAVLAGNALYVPPSDTSGFPPNPYLTNPLCLAADEGHAEIAAYLLEKGANVNLVDANGNSPLHYASRHANPDLIRRLLKKGGRVNQRNTSGNTPLFEALCLYCDESTAARESSRRAETVKFLLTGGASVNVVGASYQTPLIAACGANTTLEIVKLLVEAGADVNTNMTCACQGSMDCVESTALHAAAKQAMFGRSEIASYLLSQGADIEALDRNEATPLLVACSFGQHLDFKPSPRQLANTLDFVTTLLARKANVNAMDHTQRTPLLYACRVQSREFVELLLKAGADKEARDYWNRNGLFLAKYCEGNCRRQKPDLSFYTYLIDGLHFDINSTDRAGNTLLMQVCEYPVDLDLLRFLLEKGADADLQNDSGKTALAIAKETWEQNDYESTRRRRQIDFLTTHQRRR